MQIILPRDYQKMSWKNGGGVTEEICREPATGDYQFRLSRAMVEQDGDFSTFPGYERLLVLTEGKGLWLNSDKLLPFEVLGFAGEDAVHATLVERAVMDLGLIFRRGALRATMTVVSSQWQQLLLISGTHFFFAAESSRMVQGRLVPEAATARFDGSITLEIEAGSGRGILISLMKFDSSAPTD